MLALITGPVRSGKSSFALRIARTSGKTPVYVATAALDPTDAEMTARVARHRAERGAMRTIEVDERSGPDLEAVLAGLGAGEIALVDSLGTWLAALLLGEEGRAGADPVAVAVRIEERATKLRASLATMKADAVIVAEEVGWGVIPPSPLGRIFRDEMGRTTAALARRAERAYLVVAGYAVDLHAVGQPVTD
jgi:adenosylcobinamide kinase/adenosylcobinamide-phosphate guanylyltransferase